MFMYTANATATMVTMLMQIGWLKMPTLMIENHDHVEDDYEIISIR